MPNIYEMFATDEAMETEGIWVDYGVNYGKFLVARAGGHNTKFAQVLEAKMRPHRAKMERAKKGRAAQIDNEVAEAILLETFVEAVLLDWTGVTDRKGQMIPFSKMRALSLFKDLPELLSDLREMAMEMTNFQDEQTEADAGN